MKRLSSGFICLRILTASTVCTYVYCIYLLVVPCPPAGEEWRKLPHVTPAQIVAAKEIRKLFTGKLDAPVSPCNTLFVKSCLQYTGMCILNLVCSCVSTNTNMQYMQHMGTCTVHTGHAAHNSECTVHTEHAVHNSEYSTQL